MRNGIDFLVVSYYRLEYITLLVESIKKFVTYPYLVTVIANEKKESEDYKKLISTFENDDKYLLSRGNTFTSIMLGATSTELCLAFPNDESIGFKNPIDEYLNKFFKSSAFCFVLLLIIIFDVLIFLKLK